MKLGGFSLVEETAEPGSQVSQMYDQCQICDSDGKCWDYDGDDGGN